MMQNAADVPDTIVLVHGFWVRRGPEHWITHYEAKGFRVLAPAYPGFDVEVEALNADPTPIETVTVPEIIARFEGIIGELDKPPILMGTPRAARSCNSCSTTASAPRVSR